MLELLSQEPFEMTLKEISQRLNIPLASLWRILGVLTRKGYLIYDAGRHTYRLGFKLISMGNFLLESSHYRSQAREDLRKLAETTGETVELDARVKDQLVLLEQVVGPEGLYLYSHPGSTMPFFHATAPGKVYLSQLSQERLREVMGKIGFPRFTPRTIQSLDDLEEELRQVRKNGYAVDIEEMRQGVARVAAPIYNTSGRVIACVAIVCPSFRLSEPLRIQRYGEAVKKTAESISLKGIEVL